MIGPTSTSMLRTFYNMNLLTQRNDKLTLMLSTGKNINSPSDDPSLFFRLSKLRHEISGYDSYLNNANEGLAAITTLTNATQTQTDLLEKMKALAAEGEEENSPGARKNIYSDIVELIDRYDEIARTTTYNGQNLLDGTFENDPFTITFGSGDALEITIPSTKKDGLDLESPPANHYTYDTLKAITDDLHNKNSITTGDFGNIKETVDGLIDKHGSYQRSFGTDQFIVETRQNLIELQKANLDDLMNKYQEVDILKINQEMDRNKLLLAFSSAAIASMQDTSDTMLNYLFPPG